MITKLKNDAVRRHVSSDVELLKQPAEWNCQFTRINQKQNTGTLQCLNAVLAKTVRKQPTLQA